MPRYIDADALRKETEKKIRNSNAYRMAVVDSDFLDLIDDAHTEDVVEVVRCKDCIHATTDRMCDTDEIYCDCYGIYKCADGFCDDGRRMEQT